jgi:hypothetical protein
MSKKGWLTRYYTQRFTCLNDTAVDLWIRVEPWLNPGKLVP